MEPITISIITIVLLFVLILMGVHIGFTLAFVSVIGIWWLTGNFDIGISILGTTAFEAIRDYVFGVLPFFILMGVFVSNSGAAADLYNAAQGLLRKVPGGLGIATVVANAVFAAVTGVSVASAAVFSKISMPEMVRLNYNRGFALGTVAGSSVLGMLIPPSILFIVYGMLTETSIGALFVAGIVPGLVLTGIYSSGIFLMAKVWPALVGGSRGRAVTNDRLQATSLILKPLPFALLILLVLGGIWGGLFTPTEAGAIGALGGLVLALSRGMKGGGLWQSLVETGASTATILFLLICAQMYSRMITMGGLMTWMSNLITGLAIPPIVVVLLFMVVLVILGTILDSTSILLITMPLMAPVVAQLGFDLVWFGVVAVIATEMGLLTPPFGMVVYAMKAALGDEVSAEEIFGGSMPFLLMMVLALAIVVAFPSLSTWLPSLM